MKSFLALLCGLLALGASSSFTLRPGDSVTIFAAAPTPTPTPTTLALYVAPNGSDSNSGSPTAPFATIQRALSVAVSRTTINIMPGNYKGPISLPAINNLSLVGSGSVIITGSSGIIKQTALMNSLTLSGLTFQNNTDVYQGGSAVSLETGGGDGLVITGCSFLNNGWAGLTIGYWKNVSIMNFTGSANGENALEVYRVQNLVETGVTLINNNVVGYANGFIGWDAAGEKLLRIHGGTLTNVTATGNLTGGIWFDTDNENITVRNLVSEQNLTNGFNCEATQGPISIDHSIIAYNGNNGLSTGNCQGLTVTNTVIYGNTDAQVQPASSGPRTFANYVTGANMSVLNAGWTLTNDQIGTTAPYPGGYLWGNAMVNSDWPPFLSSLRSNSNDWYSPNNPNPIALPTGTTNFAGWQAYTQQDMASSASVFPAPPAPTPTASPTPTPTPTAPPGFLNPRSYGAVGNGTTNDAAAFQAALNAGSIYVPPSAPGVATTYLINTTVTATGGRTIQCDPAVTIHTSAIDTNNRSIFRFQASGNWGINHCHLTGPNNIAHPTYALANDPNILVQGWCWGASGCSGTIDSNSFEGCMGNACISIYGNDSTGPVRGGTITNNTFNGCGIYSVALVSATNWTVSGNTSTACGMGPEADDTGQLNTGNVFFNNILHVGGNDGYFNTGHTAFPVFLTCGQAVSNFDYSTNVCHDNILDSGGLLMEGGGTTSHVATYTNNICGATNGVGGHTCSGGDITHY